MGCVVLFLARGFVVRQRNQPAECSLQPSGSPYVVKSAQCAACLVVAFNIKTFEDDGFGSLQPQPVRSDLLQEFRRLFFVASLPGTPRKQFRIERNPLRAEPCAAWRVEGCGKDAAYRRDRRKHNRRGFATENSGDGCRAGHCGCDGRRLDNPRPDDGARRPISD